METGGQAPEMRRGAGLDSPEPAKGEGELPEEEPYKGGTALAPLADNVMKPSDRGSDAGETPYEALVKSMIADAPPFEVTAGAHVPASSLVASDERFDCDRSGEKKCFRRSSWDGLSLAECGMHLFEELLGVLPLRSQYMGNGDPTSVFPLPTSRSLLVSFFGEVSDCEFSWLSCVLFSLKFFLGWRN